MTDKWGIGGRFINRRGAMKRWPGQHSVTPLRHQFVLPEQHYARVRAVRREPQSLCQSSILHGQNIILVKAIFCADWATRCLAMALGQHSVFQRHNVFVRFYGFSREPHHPHPVEHQRQRREVIKSSSRGHQDNIMTISN